MLSCVLPCVVVLVLRSLCHGVFMFVRLMRVCVLRYSPPTGNTGNGDTDTRPQPRRDAHPADHAALVARVRHALDARGLSVDDAFRVFDQVRIAKE